MLFEYFIELVGTYGMAVDDAAQPPLPREPAVAVEDDADVLRPRPAQSCLTEPVLVEFVERPFEQPVDAAQQELEQRPGCAGGLPDRPLGGGSGGLHESSEVGLRDCDCDEWQGQQERNNKIARPSVICHPSVGSTRLPRWCHRRSS